jgi:iron complex transport system substrate-binding protein
MTGRRVSIPRVVLVAAVLAVAVGSFVAKAVYAPPEAPPVGEAAVPDNAPPPQRIISLSPSVTEILFALGLGGRVVGVTRYCDYPPEALAKPKVGGLQDPNLEAIVALQPDLVIFREADAAWTAPFRELHLRTLAVNHKTVEGILESMLTIGLRCDARREAERLVADLQGQLDQLERKTAGLERPRVLLALERTLGAGRIEDVYAAGRGGFLDRMITLAGGENACPPTAVPFPVLSAEGIIRINPDVILDMASAIDPGQTHDDFLADWQSLAQVEAVARGRVYRLDADYAYIPGPRLVLLAEDLAKRIHPEVEWEP